MIQETGRLVRDGELKTVTGNDTPTTVYTNAIAFYSGVKNNDTIINFEAWGSLATWFDRNFSQAKGKPITLIGYLRQREWTDNSGTKKTQLYISVREAAFVPGYNKQEQPELSGEQQEQVNAYQAALEGSSETVPF